MSLANWLPFCVCWRFKFSALNSRLWPNHGQGNFTHWSRLSFCRRHFQRNGIELLRFKQNFTETSPLGSNWQYARIISDNDLAPNRREAIIKTMMTQFSDAYNGLTHWDRDKMYAISQTTFSSVFSWMGIFWFRLKFHWSLFPRAQLTIFQHWFR